MLKSEIDADLLASTETHAAAGELVRCMTEGLPTESRLVPLLLALVSTFVGLCEQNDMDPTVAFEECADALCGDSAEDHPTLPFIN